DKNGLTIFEKILHGAYFLKTTSVNFEQHQTASFNLNASELSLPNINLQRQAKQIEGVTVTAQKPFIQKLTDRIVVNVDNSLVSAGSTATDVLERSPGVAVDQNESISLR